MANEKNLPSVRKWGKKTVIERFMSKVAIRKNCWIWTGAVERFGYGKFSVSRRSVMAHRFSYHHFKGSIPEGLTLDHLCRVPSCVNPDHLEAVTLRENLLRGNTFQAKNKAKTHCPHGHPYDKENTFIRKDGARTCKECMRARCRDYNRLRRSRKPK